MVTVTKEFTFDCAHMLSGHDGLCKNLHGHTYKIQITVCRVPETLISDGSSEGMVIDFKQLKDLIWGNVLSHFDHAFIYYDEGGSVEQKIADLLIEHDMRILKMNKRVTAENMAYFIRKAVIREIEIAKLPLLVDRITVWETPTSCAEVK